MFVHMSVHMFVRMSVHTCLCTSLRACLPAHRCVHMPVRMPVRMSTNMPVHVSARLSALMFMHMQAMMTEHINQPHVLVRARVRSFAVSASSALECLNKDIPTRDINMCMDVFRRVYCERVSGLFCGVVLLLQIVGYTHARNHARTHARMHARTHTSRQNVPKEYNLIALSVWLFIGDIGSVAFLRFVFFWGCLRCVRGEKQR